MLRFQGHEEDAKEEEEQAGAAAEAKEEDQAGAAEEDAKRRCRWSCAEEEVVHEVQTAAEVRADGGGVDRALRLQQKIRRRMPKRRRSRLERA